MSIENLSQLDYFSKKDYVSNSMLGWLKRSPAYFMMQLNKEGEKTESRALENGKLLHSFLEHGDNFVVADVVKPSGKLGIVCETLFHYKDELGLPDAEAWDKAYKSADYGKGYNLERVQKEFDKVKDYYDFLKDTQNKYALTKDQHYLILNAIKALKNNPLTAKVLALHGPDLFDTVYSELELYWTYVTSEEEEVKAKGKLDKVIVDQANKIIRINDLKSTSGSPYGKLIKIPGANTGEAVLDFYASGWFKKYIGFDYYRQKAMYIDGVLNSKIFEPWIEDGFSIEFNFVVVQLGDSFDTAVYTWKHDPTGDERDYGLCEVDELMTKYHLLFNQMNQPTPVRETLIL